MSRYNFNFYEDQQDFDGSERENVGSCQSYLEKCKFKNIKSG